MREKIFHFDHERIPERVVHARGFGAKGYFEPYDTMADVTKADLFQRAGERTEVFVRFSTVAGNKGSTDLARDVRGFAVKFYTKEGNWDLVGNNMPVFFIQDAMKFPDLVHAAKPEPDRGWPQAQTAHDNFWDFVGLMPESMHMIMWIMSDRAIPRSFRFMEGFGVHTFRFVNAEGSSTFVKFHWKPKQGLQSVVWNEALKISGADPDFHRRDLWNAIEAGEYPEWELCVQLFDDEFADNFEFDVLDATKIIPEEQLPPTPIGRMVLNQTVDNFFADLAICASDTSLAEAAQTMRARNIGDVLIRDQSDRICGIVTDRDLVVRGVAANAEPASSPVGNICDEELHSLTLDASIEDIVQLMQDKAVRRVPIMDGSEPVGIVSLGDLAQALDRDSVLGRISAARPDP